MGLEVDLGRCYGTLVKAPKCFRGPQKIRQQPDHSLCRTPNLCMNVIWRWQRALVSFLKQPPLELTGGISKVELNQTRKTKQNQNVKIGNNDWAAVHLSIGYGSPSAAHQSRLASACFAPVAYRLGSVTFLGPPG